MRHAFAHMPETAPPPSRYDEYLALILADHGWSRMSDAFAAEILLEHTALNRREIALRLDRAMERADEIWRGKP